MQKGNGQPLGMAGRFDLEHLRPMSGVSGPPEQQFRFVHLADRSQRVPNMHSYTYNSSRIMLNLLGRKLILRMSIIKKKE